jgi:exodeoxyribonuclease VII small subunit
VRFVKLRSVPKTDNSEITFEEGIQKLEAIVDAMESGDLPLETLMKQFEDGTKLAKLCQEKLSQAEVRIQQIEQSSGGALNLKPFEAQNGND